MCKQLIVIQAETASEFQEAFNTKLRELEGKDPEYEFHHENGYCAYIIYSDNQQFIGSVEPNHCICDTCARCQGYPGPRVKWRRCDIYGSIKKTDACNDYLPGGVVYGN